MPLLPIDKQALTVADVAALTGLSRQTITRMFERETGVLVVGRSRSLGNKRSYRSIRIPRQVYERVVRKVTN
jgi:AraC-like DNA-binding protein